MGLSSRPARLVSAARRQSGAFPCIPDFVPTFNAESRRAELGMIRAPVAAGGIAGPARTDPDDHIAGDGSGTSTGLRKQAGIAVGMVSGPFTDTECDCIFGGDLWSGQTLDLDEPDDVVESVEGTVASLYALGEFGCEFEDRIAATDSVRTPSEASNNLDPRLDAGDSFNGLMMSGIRFGSAAGTRFCAHVFKWADSADAASHAARGVRTRGVSACTPNDASSVGDILGRSETMFRCSRCGGGSGHCPGTARGRHSTPGRWSSWRASRAQSRN